MSNLTLSIDDKIIKQAKLRAVQDGTSLSAKIRELLQRYAMGQLDNPQAADLSFTANALLFSQQNQGSAKTPVTTHTAQPDTALHEISVDADTLRRQRGWAREDIYDQTSRHGTQ